jgi:4-amino-4-deoxy-L-arabinose transferase-like glycosyltransferase
VFLFRSRRIKGIGEGGRVVASALLSTTSAPGRRIAEGLVFTAAALLFFSGLTCPLLEPEETRYAEIPRQMLDRGNWLVPVLHGQPYYDKPPLLYWLVMASYSLFGVHDWAARLVSSGAAFLCGPITYYWGKRKAGFRAGLAGAIMLCLSARFLHLGRLLTMNSLLCLWVLLALAAAHIAADASQPRRWWLVSALACGLGMLTKGPVALVLVIVPIAVGQSLKAPSVWRLGCRLSAYAAVAVAVALPWYAAVAIVDPQFLRYFFWTHHVLRFAAPIDHAEPVWFYLPDLLLGMLPWVFLLPGTLALLYRRWQQRQPLGPVGFYLIAAVWCFCFFSAAGCKRSGYILPALPPLALALGYYFDQCWPQEVVGRSAAFAWRGCCAVAFFLLLAAGQTLLPAYAKRFSLRDEVRPFCGVTAPVACYPHRWDSVNFYLRNDRVEVYSAEQRPQMIADFLRAPRTLLFVKTERFLPQLLHELPDTLEFIPCGRQFSVTVGWVRQR